MAIHATDRDSPATPNGVVQYSLIGGSFDSFVVDINTGVVRVANNTKLNRPIYNITVNIITMFISRISYFIQISERPET